MKDPPRLPSQRDWQAIGAASGIGCSVAVSLIVCIVGGVLLDRWLGIAPVGVLVGMVLGLAAAGYSLYELATLSNPNRGVVKLKKDSEQENEESGKQRGR